MVVHTAAVQSETIDNIEHALEHYSPFRAFFELNVNAICVVDQHAALIKLNPSAEALLGSGDGTLTKPFVSLFHVEIQAELKFLLKAVMLGSTRKIETQLRCFNGQLRHLRINFIPAWNAQQQVIGAFCVLIDLTNKQQLLSKLAEREKHYRQLVEFAPVAIIVHNAGNVLFANQAAQRLLMRPLSGLDNLYQLVHPEDKPVVLARQGQPAGAILPFVEIRVQRQDQQYIDVDIGSLQIIYNQQVATLTICRDITSERAIQDAVAASEAKYRMIANNMTDLVCLMDGHGGIKYASPSHLAVLGYPTEVLEGATLSDYLHEEDFVQVREKFAYMVQQQQQIKLEARIKNASGQWVWLETVGNRTLDFGKKVPQYLMVSRDITARKALEQQLNFLAFHDSLTNLPNRRLFTEKLTQTIEEHLLAEQYLAVIYMDLDKFKMINDSLGHDVGDELLAAFALRVRTVLRDKDVMARLGGDEFVILLPELQSISQVKQIAKRIQAVLQLPWQLTQHELHTTSSMGISVLPSHGKTATELLKQADLALYQAKENGRNGFVFANEIGGLPVSLATA